MAGHDVERKGPNVQFPTTLRRLAVAAATAAVLATGAATPALAAGPTPPPPSPVLHMPPAPGHNALDPVVRLSAQRLLIADLVAAAKWGTGQAIDDPARERQVLDAAATEARSLNADPQQVVRILRDQIEASKIVQRGLFRRWTAAPSQVPTIRPDLAKIRAAIGRIDDELVHAIADTAAARSGALCGARLVVDYGQVSRELALDTLHSVALGRALPSVCEDGTLG